MVETDCTALSLDPGIFTNLTTDREASVLGTLTSDPAPLAEIDPVNNPARLDNGPAILLNELTSDCF